MWRRVLAVLLAALLGAAAFIGISARAAPEREEVAGPTAATASPRPGRSPTPRPRPSLVPSPPEPSPEPPAVSPELRAALEGLVASTPLPPGATVAVAVLDEQGREIFGAQADAPLLPASTQKLVAAAAALQVLGPQYRFPTAVLATEEVGPDGTLAGDLVLVGGGDPVLASPIFAADVEPERPHTPLAALADQVVAAGVRRVTGVVIGDASAYADEPLPEGWTPQYLTEMDGVRTSALTIDAGRRMGIRDGRLFGEPEEDPAAQAALQLRLLLEQRGVVLQGPWASTTTPQPAVIELGRVESPPLIDLVAELLRTSDNQLADQIFRSVGAVAGEPSWRGSEEAAREALEDLGLDWEGVRLADGSGLSREDRVTARFLAALDIAMTDAVPEWEGMQAVAGRSGTLRQRLRGTIAEGRLRGKTGSLRDVRALSGALARPDGARRHLAVVANGLSGEALEPVRNLTDAIVLTVAAELYGCAEVSLPPADAPPAAPGEHGCAA